MSGTIKLTPGLRSMLERIQRGTDSAGALLVLVITSAGGRSSSQLLALRNAGFVEWCDHPTIKNGSYPAAGVRITDAGRAALSAIAGRR